MKLGVLGAGAWGTALAIGLSPQHRVRLWARDGAHAALLARTRENARYLPGCTIPADIEVSADWQRLADCEALVCAVPVAGVRAVLARLADTPARPVVFACKGFERGTGLLPHQVAAALLPAHPVCVLSGPSFAQEVANALPAAVVLAAADSGLASSMARALHSTRLRIYSNTDLVGVEVAGATKNVMAIAAGICDGLGLGLNARAAMITRGIAEVARLGLKLGGRMETFMGLAGLGDLILTCTGNLSRNRTVGLQLAQGRSVAEILGALGLVAEGVDTAYEVAALAERLGIEMPITHAVCAVLRAEQAPADAVAVLLERDPRAEF
jgi:glycerol-3-phosphate dehydrogenase (NAD(P)+)